MGDHIAELVTLAEQHGAINLSQGFPDFDGPPEIVAAAVAAMRAGHNALVTPDVKNVLGRDPISFEQFADHHAAQWR